MLTAHRIPKACHSCRLQLLTLFEHGFTTPIASNATRTRHSAFRTLQPRRAFAIRSFSTGIRRMNISNDTPTTKAPSSAEIEAVVREARQTFGETLPKDYLSAEEYILYERLYGPPLRETKAEDLEYIPGGEEEIIVDQPVRNILLRETVSGEYEEVEFDPSLGFRVVDESNNEVKEFDGAADLEGRADEAEESLDDLDSPLAMEGRVAQMEEDLMDELITEANLLEPDVGANEEFESSEQGNEVFDNDIEEGEDITQSETVSVQGRNQREVDVISRLQKDMDDALARPAEEEEDIDEEYEEEEEEEEIEEDEEDEDGPYTSSDEVRTHPHTMTGRSGTHPSTLSLSKAAFITPVTELLERTNMKHLTAAAELAFGGKGLPHSSLTRIPKASRPQKHIGLDASQHRMSELEADAFMAGVMPGTYASVMSTLVEVRKRLGSQWVRDLLLRSDEEGPRVLDAGAAGAGAIAWREVAQAEWDILKDEGTVKGEIAPSGKTTVLTGAPTLRHRISKFLDNTTFLPRLPDYVHSSNSEALLDGAPAQQRKSYDIIIAPHTLLPLKEDFRRKHMVQNLWSLLSPNGGVLIMIEKGLPRGFEAIAGARSLLLDTHISSPGESVIEEELQSPNSERFREKEPGMIIAPCTNHTGCPMYTVPGFSYGRKDFCHFGQRFLRPNFLQRLLGASARNHEDVKYSYIAIRRGMDPRREVQNPVQQGDDATLQAFQGYEFDDLPESSEPLDQEPSDIKFNAQSLPRLILPSLKRRGHVTLDLCTPSGKLERWTVPKSFSKPAYRDARKSKWGDLWALGGKTRTLRSPRLGRPFGDDKKTGLKGIRDGRIGKGGKKAKKNQFDVIMGKQGVADIRLSSSQSKFVNRGKRTKDGRIYKAPKPIGEDDL